MSEEKLKEKPQTGLKVTGIVFAWLSVPIIGLLLLFITTSSSTIQQSLLALGKHSDIALAALNGLLGIILILLLILVTNKVRKKSYFFHLRIGLFIGLGIYSLILIVGLAMNLHSTYSWNDPAACTTPKQQFNAHGSAIVPIATNLGTGTGFAVSNNTTILTAYHVVEGATSIVANYSAGEVKMEVIETAPQYDLALLKIDKPTDSFFSLSESYATADDVYAYGYPGNSLTAGPPSLTTGIISRVVDLASLRMTSQDAADGLEIIQTDAAINPGNSGGPLIGSCGVVGVVSFISDTSELNQYLGSVSEQNIGFAISSKTAKTAFPQL
jgi:S1-C subfamily serine protease